MAVYFSPSITTLVGDYCLFAERFRDPTKAISRFGNDNDSSLTIMNDSKTFVTP
jgi:hypothetical protein